MMIQKKLKNLLTNYGISFHENQKSIITECLGCGKEDHLWIHKLDGIQPWEKAGMGKCFKCDETWNPPKMMVYLSGCSWDEARAHFRTGERINPKDRLDPTILNRNTQEEISILKPESIIQPLTFKPMDSLNGVVWPGFKYMLEREIDKFKILDLARKYNLKYCTRQKRLIFPIYYESNLVGYQGRDITGNSEIPYLSSENFPRSKVLLGANRITTIVNYTILTEGPFDFLKVASLFDNVICSLGKELTKGQIRLIKNFKGINRIYLALDPDAAIKFDEIATQLEPEKQVYIMQPPEEKKDFGECTQEEIYYAWQNAIKWSKASYISSAILR